MAVDINTVIPDFSVSIIDPMTGRIDPIWYQFLLKIFDRTEILKNAVTDVLGSPPIQSSGGTTPTISILPVTTTTPGAMLALDKIKLDSVTAGAAVSAVAGTAPIVSSGGTAPTISITAATTLVPGSMSASDKAKLDGITPGAGVASVSGTAPIVSSGGATPAISITAATGAAAGSMSAADKTKLDAAATIVTSVSGTAPIVSSGGTTPAVSITAATGAAAGSMSAADKAKLDLLTYTAPTAWTPVLSFDTPGTLAITYAAQVGRLIQIGSKVSLDFCIVTSAFTLGTATGFMRINGMTVPANASFSEWNGSMSWGGIPIVGFMNIVPAILTANTSVIRMIASGNNVARAQLSTGNTTSGTNVTLIGHIEYFV